MATPVARSASRLATWPVRASACKAVSPSGADGKDAGGIVAFYTKAFGLTQDSMAMGPAGTYYLLKDGAGQMRAGIMQQEPGVNAPSSWLPYIEVADCDASTQLAMKLGAKQTIAPPMEVENIGRFSIVMDPFGAPIGLIKAAG